MKYIIYTGLIVLYCSAPLAKSRAEVLEPPALQIFVGSTGKAELYWYYPGLYESSLGNLDRVPDNFGAMTTQAGRNALLTPFRLNPPAMINTIETYIINYNPFPDMPGNQFTPVSLLLYEQTGESCFLPRWCQEVSLDTAVSAQGEIVGLNNLNIAVSDYDVWMGIEWMVDIEYMPLIGISNESPYLGQFVWDMTDPECRLLESQNNYMVGICLSGWTGSPDNETTLYDIDTCPSFEILYAEDSIDFISRAEIINSVNADSLYSVLDIEKSGYLAVRANDGVSTACSQILYFDPANKAPLEVEPPFFEMPRGKGMTEYYYIAVTNTGLEKVAAAIGHDSLILQLNSDSLEIDPGERKEIGLYLLEAPGDDSVLTSSITFSVTGKKYPLIHHLKFIASDPTDVEEKNTFRQGAFSIGPPSPNPFNSGVAFRYEAASQKSISLDVYDILGRCIYSECLNGGRQAGNTYVWPVDKINGEVSSGIYFFRFSGDHSSVTKRAVLIK